MQKLRLAIIGCNNMGKKHLNILRQHFASYVDVVGILNSTPESTARRAAELDIGYFNSLDEITSAKVDGAIISTPAITHAAIGKELLHRGIPCLIEKPLGTTMVECRQLTKAAEESKEVLLVGHSENFNPAVIRLKKELRLPIKRINAVRTSRNCSNHTGISAVQELMIHDLAIVYSLLGGKNISTSLSKRGDLSWENHAVSSIKYPAGAVVTLEALRADVEVQRFMDLEDEEGNKFHIDFLSRSLSKNGSELCSGGDTLVNELSNFIGCLQKVEQPLVGGKEASEILRLCLIIEKGIPRSEKPHLANL